MDLKFLTDEELAEHVRGKDKEAYLEVVLRYQQPLLRYAGYLVRDQAKAADIVQNAFIKAFVNLNGFDSRRKFSTWLYRIAHNEAIDELRRGAREVSMPEGMDFESEEDVQADLMSREEAETAKRCLALMPLMYREPLSLYFLEDKSYEEISDILRVPIGTVGTRINRAKQLMKKICQTKASRISPRT